MADPATELQEAIVRIVPTLLREAAAFVQHKGELAFTISSMRPKPWPPKKDGSPARLLRTGNLRHSFRADITGRDTITITTPVKYAPVHQFGAPSRSIPARPYMPLQPNGRLLQETSAELVELLENRLNALLRP